MKSECIEHQKRIPALCLEDLTEDERKALEAHLATCSQCRSERESYAKTMQQLASVGNEEIPRHFFIYPEEPVSNPWRLFQQMPLGWRTALACAAGLLLVVCIAAISRLRVQSGSAGWAVSFGTEKMDTGALKKEILEAADRKNQEARAALVHEMREEIVRSTGSLSKQQQLQLTTALAQIESRVTGRIRDSESQVRGDTQILVSDMYRAISRQRSQDIEAINLRLDSTDANNAVKAHRTNEILDTLLQVADLGLR